MTKLITSFLALALTTGGLAYSFAAKAQGPNFATPHHASGLADCERAAWPAYGSHCLLTIDGKPLERVFRVASAD